MRLLFVLACGCTAPGDSYMQDVPIVGCACSGVMGVGPDSKPVEVDPACGTQVVRRVNASRKKQGLPALPTKGVSVLLGKLPSGCVVRAVAVEVRV